MSLGLSAIARACLLPTRCAVTLPLTVTRIFPVSWTATEKSMPERVRCACSGPRRAPRCKAPGMLTRAIRATRVCTVSWLPEAVVDGV